MSRSAKVKRPNMQRRTNEATKDTLSMPSCGSLSGDSMQNQNCSVETDALKIDDYCFSGHMTRRAKRSLQMAMSNGLTCVPVISSSAVPAVSLSSDLFTTCCSPSSSMTTTQSSASSVNLSSALNTVLTPSVLEGSGAMSTNVIKCHSIIAHILTGEDKDLAENANGRGDILSDDDKAFDEAQATLDVDCGDVSSYLEESLRANLAKFETSTTDWDLVTCMPDCAKKEIAASPDPDLALDMDDSMSFLNTWSKCAVFLVAHDDAKSTHLRQDIMEALQIPDIKVVKPCEAVDVCSLDSLVMIWVHVPIPVQEELLCTVSSLRYSSKKAKSVYVIAIIDKQSDVDLCLHGFDDVYMEPIPKDTILQKYQKVKFVSLSEISGTNCTDSVTTMRGTTSTPESTISLESVRTAEYSQSSNCDSVSSGMDIHDISISDLKSTLSVPLCSKSPFLSEGTEADGGRSPIIDPQSPNWCRLEHATKEKQRSLARKLPAHTEKERRERIKDSCDQLRVLLPYVKGRKTDMASILEMTVDYLKIVNAALPQDFQSHVIDIMSNGNPALEGRLGEMEKVSITTKKVNRRRIADQDISPVGKKQQIVEKATIHMNYDCNIDQSLNSKTGNRLASHTDASSTGVPDKINIRINSSTTKDCPSQNTNNANVIKRESVLKKSGSSKPKRPHMAIVSTTADVNSPSVVYLPAGNITPIKESKKENILGEVTNQSQHFTDNQFAHLFTEGDIPANHMFTSSNIPSDIFPYQSHTQMNTSVARVSATDRGDLTTYGGIYFDGAFCHYYPQLQDSSSSNYFGVGGNNEFVNPNAAPPMTSYVPRPAAFSSSHKFECTSAEFDRYGIGDQKTDIFNNCNITGLKPNNT